MKRGAVAATAAALALLAGGLWVAGRKPAGPPVPAAPSGPASRDEASPGGDDAASHGTGGPAGDVAGEARPGPRPRSLRGTRPDGGLATDANGRFVPTIDARRLFDYFLAASGEESEQRILLRLRTEIARRLPSDAARDASLLLDRYLAYRARARELAEAGLDDADLATRLERLHELRRETLGDEAAEAFFAEEEAADRAAVERRRVAEDPSLSAEERAAKLAELDASLPPAEAARRREGTVALEVERSARDLRAQGASPEEVQALRERLVGPEAAARLATLDERRAEWRRRIEAYREALRAVEGDPTLDDAGKRAAMERILAERFSGAERPRAETLVPSPTP